MWTKEDKKKWIENNREHIRAYDRARYAKDSKPKLDRASKRYELKKEEIKAKVREYNKNTVVKRNRERLEQIAGRTKPDICEVCGAAGKIFFDHDHITGKFRGWICMQCNLALGHARDNTALLYKLIGYLDESRKSSIQPQQGSPPTTLAAPQAPSSLSQVPIQPLPK